MANLKLNRIYHFEKQKIIANDYLTQTVMNVDLKNDMSDGIELAKKINMLTPYCQIIYVSELIEYAPRVYDTIHCSFILREYIKDILPKAIDKSVHEIITQKREKKYIKITYKSHSVMINIRDIMYIEREGRQIIIVTRSQIFNIYQSLNEIIKKLPDIFIRCHTGYIVNFEYITYIAGTHIRLISDKEIPIGRAYNNEFKAKYARYWSSKI